MDNYKGYVDVFPTRIHKVGLDTKVIPTDVSSEELNFKGYADVLRDPKYKTLNEMVLKEASSLCPRHPNIGDWKIVAAWINKQSPGEEGFVFHSHADSFMSCVLYVEGSNMSLIVKEEPKTSKATNATQDCFFDIVVRHSWHPEVELPAENGDLLVFPSYQIHKANKNTTDQDRISIAYNLLPSKIHNKKDLPWLIDLEL